MEKRTEFEKEFVKKSYVFNNFPDCRYRTCGQRRYKRPDNVTRYRVETITATARPSTELPNGVARTSQPP